ncbi:hypothetical protein CJD38_02130 [Stenotrophobium rhamnosiphilum]|uniref:Tetratricopeptide repeat protein n=1 Tax=Stenotrophobium rhamnosiphilum TaxID=2029166 RepID=A0A2T5MK35_9GAMM|nr:hypothetical protein CJD38_02130 [Stenotrophobium rhamnosiphilum]
MLLSALIVLVACGVYSNARWILAESYLRFSEQRGQSSETRSVAQQAAGIALKLQPYSARAVQSQASNDLFLNKPQKALDEYVKALTLAPADAYLWRDYALALVNAGIFDQRLDRAVLQAQTWARKSKPIHMSLAVVGLRVFSQSSPSLRAQWLNSIRFAYWTKPAVVLWYAYVEEQELLLCDNTIILQADTNAWCAAARWRHGLCSNFGAEADSCFRKPVKKS